MELLVLPNMAETPWGCAAPVHGGSRDSPKSLLLASMVALRVGIQVGTGMKSPSGCSSVRKAGSVAGLGQAQGFRDSTGAHWHAQGFRGRQALLELGVLPKKHICGWSPVFFLSLLL